ncbi:hypothetical protein H6P81_006285 [Aristolochia fimbriata]|uniref:Aminotransferase-like plant mobile domain-containing protein n=1 Tax=Aristolochia fimbriata TaxID=158543 RepID=A0AAV7EY26_ARIFI|nr:hypothetical protein H6P81_006285 [Aristolochia fimbriata]
MVICFRGFCLVCRDVQVASRSVAGCCCRFDFGWLGRREGTSVSIAVVGILIRLGSTGLSGVPSYTIIAGLAAKFRLLRLAMTTEARVDFAASFSESYLPGLVWVCPNRLPSVVCLRYDLNRTRLGRQAGAVENVFSVTICFISRPRSLQCSDTGERRSPRMCTHRYSRRERETAIVACLGVVCPWSRPVVNEDNQICFLPGVGEAPSSPHKTQGAILLSPMHDTLVRFSTLELYIDSNRFGPREVRTIEVVSPRHIPFYFEWADVVLRTCLERLMAVDLVHAARASILGGLPITGGIFDETFPSMEDFSPGHRFPLPESIKYLILAYYRLAEPSEWTVNPGSRCPIGCPSGSALQREYSLRKMRGLIARGLRPLAELGVPNALADEVYLPVFLSLWLCRCILPMPGGMLRFTILNMACYLANGYKCNLAVAALAGLYRGLNSSSCGRVPWPFVYAWLAQYFGVHGANPSEGERPLMMIYRAPAQCRAYTQREACALFWHDGVRCWYPSQALPPGPIVDKPGHLASRIEVDYFRCLRATRLVLRQRDLLIVESYSPHRFLIGDQRRAPSVESLVETWQAESVFPLGMVEVPPFTSPDSDQGVTALYRESWLKTIVPLFEWKKFTGEPAPKKKTRPKRGAVKRKTLATKPAKQAAKTPAPVGPVEGVVIRETPPALPAEQVSRPSSLSSPSTDASVDKGKRVVDPKSRSGLRRPSTPSRDMRSPTVSIPGSREDVIGACPIAGSVEEAALRQGATPVLPSPEQPRERRRLGWVGGDVSIDAATGRLEAGKADCPLTISSDENETSSPPLDGEGGVEFCTPASDLGRRMTTTPEEGPFIGRRPNNEAATPVTGEGGLEPVRWPVSENSSTSRFTASSSLSFSVRSRGWIQQSAMSLWVRFIQMALAPAEDPCSPELMTDARGLLEHLRVAGIEQLRYSAAEKHNWSECRAIEVEIAHSIRRVHCRHDAMTKLVSLRWAECKTVESDREAVHEHLAKLEAQLDSLRTEIGVTQAELKAFEDEASALERRLDDVRV